MHSFVQSFSTKGLLKTNLASATFNIRFRTYLNEIQRPLDISFKGSTIELGSRIFHYESRPNPFDTNTTISVDLFSMVHIGDHSYYNEIESLTKNYDAVLYELITSQDLTIMEENSNVRKKLLSEVYAVQADVLARQYNLSTQLDLNLLQPSWYIADLSKEVVDRLEAIRKPLTNSRFLASQIGGRAFSERLTLRNFFLSDSAFITTLRLLSWLLPCPELAVLLVDWSRMYPRPGGFPLVLAPIFEKIFAGDIRGAQKLAFAQQLISGLPDSGGWGGAARSDIEVRVSARNAECCRVLQGILDENRDVRRVAVLYGAYHIEDLRRRFLGLGLRPVASSAVSNTPSRLVAWRMWRPLKASNSPMMLLERSSANINTQEEEVADANAEADAAKQLRIIAFTVFPLYLTAGAIDWWICLTIGAKALSYSVASVALDDSPWVALGVLYLISYLQRHIWVLQTLSQVAVQWDRPLFEEDVVRASRPTPPPTLL
eukprot:gene5437-10906_t